MTNWNQIVFVTKLLLVKDSCNMGANNTITTASSSSSGAPRRPTSFLTRNTCSMELLGCTEQLSTDSVVVQCGSAADGPCLILLVRFLRRFTRRNGRK